MFLWASLLLCLCVCCCGTAQPVEEVIVAREAPLLGGWFERSPDSAEVQAAAQHALKTFNANPKIKRLFKLVSITAAQSQVTNKVNFRIQAVLGKTGCLKSEDLEPSSCPADRKQVRCRFQVTFDPRNDQHQLQDRRCRKVEKTL